MKQNARELMKRAHAGLILGIIVVLYISFYLVQTIKHNYDLQKQISGLQQQINTLNVQKDQLRYQIQYYQTDSYQEKEARAKLGLQAPGESVVILPHGDPQKSSKSDKPKPKPHKSNQQQWLDFILGRS